MQRADKRRYHYIYKITRDDGRYYIGMHSTDDLDDGYFGSGKLITRSIKKHGREKHTKEILELLESRALLVKREKELVSPELVRDVQCMNLGLGGHGGWMNNPNSLTPFFNSENRKKAAVAAAKTIKSRRENEDYRTAYSKKLSAGNKGRTPWLGKTHSEETRLKMRETHLLRQTAVGENNSQYGTVWVTDGNAAVKIKKEKLSEYLKNGYSRGRKNAP